MCSQIVHCSTVNLMHSITILNTVTAAAPLSGAASVSNGEVSCRKLKLCSSLFHVVFIQQPPPLSTLHHPPPPPPLSTLQVLMLKSLLSRAEIDKRKLQLQLDIKVNLLATQAAGVALTCHVTFTHSRLSIRSPKTRNLRVHARTCGQGWVICRR